MCATRELRIFRNYTVVNCWSLQTAGTSADMWAVGVVTYMLLTGGKSPFYDGSRFKTMAKALKCEYEVDIPEFSLVSPEARDLVQVANLNSRQIIVCPVKQVFCVL